VCFRSIGGASTTPPETCAPLLSSCSKAMYFEYMQDQNTPGPVSGQQTLFSPSEPTLEQRVIALEAESRAQKQTPKPEDLAGVVKTGEKWLIWINGLLLVATIIIAGIYIGQLTEMRRSTRAAQRAAYAACIGAKISRNVLLEAQGAEADAHGSAIATVYQAMAATEAERAEMQLLFAEPEISDKEFGIGINLKNAGKTAAVAVRAKFRLVFVGESEQLKFTYPPRQTAVAFSGRAEPGVAYDPTHGRNQIVAIDSDGNVLIPGDSDKREYQAGKKDLVLFGRVTYQDIFGGYHWRNFCQPFHIQTSGIIKAASHPNCALYNGGDIGSGLVNPAPISSVRFPAIPEITCNDLDESR
jgi:hypothetical protein